MTIHELLYKIKRFQGRLHSRELYTAALIVLVGFASFGLGRLSKLQEARSSIHIEQTLSPQTAAALSSSPPFQGGDRGAVASSFTDEGLRIKDSDSFAPGGQFVASKGGTKYHFPWCSGAQRIAEANKVWFTSVEEARKAGYTPASNCKGLR